MGWFAKTLEAIREQTRHDPVECPRGWGQVSFVGSGWIIPPLAGLERSCPIGGVSSCGACEYPANPDAFRLAEQLAELERLRDTGGLSAPEYAARRAAAVRIHSVPVGGWQRTTAWILGPLGLLLTVAGAIPALQIHPGFWAITALGCVMLALAVSFWALARQALSDAQDPEQSE